MIRSVTMKRSHALLEDYRKENNDCANDDHKQNKKSKYRSLSCIEMSVAMRKFKSNERSTEKTNIKLYDILAKEYVYFKHPINIEDFKVFEKMGNAFAISATDSYAIPLIFDFDCKKCKSGTHNRDMLCASEISLHAKQISQFIQERFNIRELYSFSKNRNGCGFHMHFLCSVSIILYELIIQHLESLYDLNAILNSYIIDKPTFLPLPYSAKTDGETYITAEPLFNYTLLPINKFYDVGEYRATSTVGDYIISTANTTPDNVNHNFDDDIWFVEKQANLSCSFNFEIVQTNSVPTLVSELINANGVIEPSFNLLQKYIKNMIATKNVELDMFDYSDSNLTNNTIYTLLCNISTNMYRLVFDVIDPQQTPNYLLYLLTINECRYAFHLICASISYIIDTIGSEKSEIFYEETKRETLKVLMQLLKKGNNNIVLSTSITNFDRVECMNELYYIYGNQKSTEFFKTICRNIKFSLINTKITTESIVRIQEMLYKTMFINTINDTNELPNDDCADDVFTNKKSKNKQDSKIVKKESIKQLNVNVLCILCPLYKKHSDSEDAYLYSHIDGRYKVVKSKVMACKQVPEIYQVMQTIDRKIREAVLTEYLVNYVKDARDCVFNNYKYFIQTKYGVFNSITGYYMHNLECLYFYRYKEACTISFNDFSLNNYNLHTTYNYLHNFIGSFIANINAFKFMNIIIPGLLNISEVFISRNDITLYIVYILESMANISKIVIDEYHMFIDTLLEKYTIDYEKYKIISCILQDCVGNDKSTITYSSMSRSFMAKTYLNYTESTDDVENIALTIIIYILLLHTNDAESKLLKFIQTESDCNKKMFTYNAPNKYNFKNISLASSYTSAHENINFILMKNGFSNTEYNNLIIPTLILLCEINSYNEKVIYDYIMYGGSIYQPGASRHQFQLYYGVTRSGKSTLCRIHAKMNSSATFSLNSQLQDSLSEVSTSVVNMYNSYLTILNEVKFIDAPTIKAITGGDVVEKRLLFSNDSKKLAPFMYVIGCCNELPTIKDIDDAIKDRVMIFKFENTAYNINNDSSMTNRLSFAVNRKIIERTVDINNNAVVLANLFYMAHFENRERTGLIQPKPTNEVSIMEIERLMIKNSIHHKVLSDCGIVFKPGYSILKYELDNKLLASAHVQHMKLTKPTYGDYFLRSFEDSFQNYLFTDIYVGFGIAEEFDPLQINDIIESHQLAGKSEVEMKKILYKVLPDAYDNIPLINAVVGAASKI